MEKFQEERDSVRLADLSRAFNALAEFAVETRVIVETLADAPILGQTEPHRKWLTRKYRAMTELAKVLRKHEANTKAKFWSERAEEVKKELEKE